MPRPTKHYNALRTSVTTTSVGRKGRGRGGQRRYTLPETRLSASGIVKRLPSITVDGDCQPQRSRRGTDIVRKGSDNDDVTHNEDKSNFLNSNKAAEPNNLVLNTDSTLLNCSNFSATIGTSSSLLRDAATGPQAGPLGFDLGATPITFWHRVVDHRRLLQSLENSGAALVASEDEDILISTLKISEMALFSVGADRLETCLQAILDLKRLISYQNHVGKDLVMGAWCVPRRYFRASLALAHLCESAIPTRLPPLVSADLVPPPEFETEGMRFGNATGPSPTNEDDSAFWWPSPISLVALQERLSCLCRLLRLRQVYGVLAPLVRECKTRVQLMQLLMPAANSSSISHAHKDEERYHNHPSEFVLLSTTPKHGVEERIISQLLLLANQACELEAESWGAFAMFSPLRVQSGLYTVHSLSRQEALVELLKREEEVYGLPPFLRFIRRAEAGSTSAYDHAEGLASSKVCVLSAPCIHHPTPAPSYGFGSSLSSPVSVTNASKLPNSSRSYFFPSPEFLDQDTFVPSSPGHYPTVQEELIDIAAKHGCFGLVIGEADQILQLWRDWVLSQTSSQRLECKQEDVQDGEVVPSTAIENDEIKQSGLLGSATERPSRYYNGHHLSEKPYDFHQGVTASRHFLLSRDPLLPFVHSTINRAIRMKKKLPNDANCKVLGGKNLKNINTKANESLNSVFWLCENRWSTKMVYFGLIFEVAFPNQFSSCDADDGTTPLVSLNAESLTQENLLHTQGTADFSNNLHPVYYPNCLLELSR